MWRPDLQDKVPDAKARRGTACPHRNGRAYPNQTRDHLFKVSGVEGPAEDPVGGGQKGDQEVEGPVEDPGPPGGQEVRLGGAGLPIHHRCEKVGAG